MRVDLDTETGRAAGRYAHRYRLAFKRVSLEDFLLAATAQAHRCPLWAGKRKHYPMEDNELFTG